MTTRTSADRGRDAVSIASRTAPAPADPVTLPATAMSMQGRAGNVAVSGLLTSVHGGRPMTSAVQDEMERRFDHDFSEVRLHADGQSARMAEALNARALTIGHDVIFNEGRFDPESTSGRWLLAHELAHVVQQSRGGTVPPIDTHAAHELAANDAAAQVLGGSGLVTVSGATGVGVARAGSGTPNAPGTGGAASTIADPAEFYKPLDVGEERVVTDLGGHSSTVTRPRADVIRIDAEIRAGQKTPRGEFQKGALPGENFPFLIGEGGFERLHAIGPLVGYESPHGIFWGPFELNRRLQEHGIETHLADLRDQLPAGGKLLLTVIVERELGSGKLVGHEFLKSISYRVERLLPGETASHSVLRQDIVVEQPQNPASKVDFGEPMRFSADPLKKGMSATKIEPGRVRRVPDLRTTEDRAKAQKLFDTAVTLRDSLRNSGGPEAVYATLLDDRIREIGSVDRMTMALMEELEKELNYVKADLKEIQPKAKTIKSQAVSPPTSKPTSKPAAVQKPAPAPPAAESKPIPAAHAPIETPTTVAAPPKAPGQAIETEVPATSVKTATQDIARGLTGPAPPRLQEVETPQLIGPGPVESPGGLAVANAGQLLVDIQRGLEIAAAVRDASRAGSLRTLRWWLQRDVQPKARGVIDRWGYFDGRHWVSVEDEHVDDLMQILARAAKGTIDGIEVRKPDPADFPAFESWVTKNIHTMEDLYHHFVQLDAGVHWDLDTDRWEVVTWTWSDIPPANVSDSKEEDAHISAFMKTVEARVVGEARTNIKARGERGSTSADGKGARIAGVRRFKKGTGNMYNPETQLVVMYWNQWTQAPVFQEIEDPSIPAGYALVAGADLFTELNILHLRSTYGRFLTAGGGPVIGAPSRFDRSRPFTGWNNADLPVMLVEKDALE